MQVTKKKIVMLGDQSVGKTSIINRLVFDSFTGSEQPTVGVDFVSKTVNIDDKTIRLQLWDTAGQERFHSLIPSYIKDSAIAIIVFDITNQVSFNSISKWINDVREERGTSTVIYVLGNKTDLAEERVVQNADAAAFLKKENIEYFEVSAKSGDNVIPFFKSLSEKLSGAKKPKEEGKSEEKQPGGVSLRSPEPKDPKTERKGCSC
jgi:small GTP-binding protein